MFWLFMFWNRQIYFLHRKIYGSEKEQQIHTKSKIFYIISSNVKPNVVSRIKAKSYTSNFNKIIKQNILRCIEKFT